MKTILLLTALTATLVTSPAIIPSRVRMPVPRVVTFSKKTQKFLRYL
jgi:hypothetical protein